MSKVEKKAKPWSVCTPLWNYVTGTRR